MRVRRPSSFAFRLAMRDRELQDARRKAAYLQLVLDAVPAPVYSKDLDGRYRACNAAFAGFVGCHPTEIIGRTVYDIAPRDVARRHEEQDRLVLETLGEPTSGPGGYWVEYESDLASAANRMTHGISRKAVLRDEKGALLGVIGTVSDVTTLKQTQEGLKRAQERFAAIIEFLPDPTFVVDAQRRVTAWNKAMEVMTGIAKSEVVGTCKYAQAFYGYERPMLLDLLLGGAQAIEQEYEHLQRDGDSVVAEAFASHLYGGKGGHVWIKANLLTDEKGEVAGAIESIRDVTDRKRAEGALEDAKRFAEKLLDRIPVPGMVISDNHEVLLWNRSLAALTGVGSAEAVGTDAQWRAFYGEKRPVLADLVLEQDIERIGAYYPHAVPSQEEPGGWRDEGWHRTGRGDSRYLVYEASPVRTSDGRIEAVIQTASDITDVKLAAEAVEESERKYRFLTERSLVGIYVTTAARFAYVNPKMTEIFGYTAEEFLDGMDPLDVVVPEDRDAVGRSVRSRLEGEVVGTAQSFRGRRKTGETIYLESYGSAIVYEGEPAIIGTIMDVTERKRAEDRILSMSSRLEEINAALKRANEELEALSSIDSLTGLANRRMFDKQLQDEWWRAVRERNCLALVMADVDFFKSYNDTYGHPRGDECLKKVAEVLRGAARRAGDLAARFGGEEFVLLLANTPPAGAKKVAARVLSEVEALCIAHPGSCVSRYVTLSVGVAVVTPDQGDSPHALVAAADDALYRAKTNGRNRMEVAGC